jgi:hypothetical protein
MCSWLVLAFKGASGNIGCSSGAMQSSGKARIATSSPNQPNWSRYHAVHEWMRNLRVRHGWSHTSREHWVTNLLSVRCSRLALVFKGASDDPYAHMHICTYAHKNADTQAQAHAHKHTHTHSAYAPTNNYAHTKCEFRSMRECALNIQCDFQAVKRDCQSEGPTRCGSAALRAHSSEQGQQEW